MASKGKLGTRDRQDKWRDNIATTQILKRVQNQAVGITHFIGKKEIAPMTAIDVKCAEMLLARSFPATKQVEVASESSGKVEVTIKKYSYADDSE